MDLSRLDQAFEFEKETSQHGGLVVVRHGYLVYEKYFGKGNREAHPGHGVDRQSLHQYFVRHHAEREARSDSRMVSKPKYSLQKYLPQAFPLDDPAKADIKLGQLLSMSSGLHGEGGNPGFVNGIAQKLEPASPPRGTRGPGSERAADSAVDQARRRIFLRVKFSAHCVDRHSAT